MTNAVVSDVGLSQKEEKIYHLSASLRKDILSLAALSIIKSYIFGFSVSPRLPPQSRL